MAFDNATRARLQRFVAEARTLLTEDFSRQLQQTYGMDPVSGEVSELESLRHLDDQRLETAQLLREIFEHYLATETAKGKTAAKAVLDRMLREQAFTILNRLAALRMMEARGILIEAIGKGTQSQAFQLYQRVANGALGETGEAYKHFLNSLFDLYSADLPALFDRFAPESRLFPREATLTRVLELINDYEIARLWPEDETIGWIYQYFNSLEERRAMRQASQAPRNSRELAVRNQFFTPRYVVEFLVDNTLGRLWFNWTGGQTALRDRCQYLLVKPDEQPEPAARLRDPRTIKLLDPACGSMHFGLYAFDLFQEVYREAWEWEQTNGPDALDRETGGSPDLKPLAETYPDRDAFLREVPRLIIERNIYGVDIDPRAAQIASLALWLRAQRAWHEAEVKAKDRPQVGQGHVVAAVAPPAELELRKQFMEGLDPRDAELFEQTLFMLKGLPELGVLLQVEKELPALIRKVFGEHGEMFAKEDSAQWQKAETRLRDALTDYAGAAQSTYQGRLFAEDALQGLRMIDHCRETFDVVVMNPPFGELSTSVKDYLGSQYPRSKNDLLTIFVERGLGILRNGGELGAITSRTCFFLSSYQRWREEIVLGIARPNVMCDLGHGVMDDAMVEAAAYVLEKVA
ncbi:BREX-1 system adenine-specific DNA-methyltransferase PglX [Defluviimonas sp. WL0024]|uniref:site-specific DNA-methyltransferase (adenine-specific) n=1 Tax=Albidovulum salinarum TaxID=2984153 RepID=A0ABT2X5U1_9RHOB|nr:BREX-1 system adenine-specific DNA-methyltransferase PglX [Defluviimonas sp. WL0024]MCU9849315.1 BREX-1 system adenine-specific DNA-methyltransferase PglX [Defluviimonas sp. WL0024]